MTILSRYIAATWLRLLALCQGSFLAVYIVLDMMDKVPRFIRFNASGIDMALFFVYKLPEMLGLSAAFSVLMATMLTLAMLERSSEITAMRSGGVSLLRIATPMLFLGGVCSLLLLVNAELIAPVAYERRELVEQVAIRKRGMSAVFKQNNIWYRSGDMIIQAQMFDPQCRTLRGVIIWGIDKDLRPLSRIDADAAVCRDDDWLLTNPKIKEFSGERGYVTSQKREMPCRISLKVDDLKILNNGADNMSFTQLRTYAQSLQAGGYPAHRYYALMHGKLSTPFSALVMVILGIPFSLRNSRSGGVALGVGASIAIGFAYFVVNAVCISYGRSGVLPPLLAAWGANLLFAAAGVWLAMTAKR